MDYKKKYNEALEWARQFSEHPLQEDSSNIVEYIFPELRESENERTRKEIISFLQLPHKQFVGERKQERWIAWLEKQEGCEHIKKDWLDHIKQSWYKEGFIDGKYSGGTSKEWTINDAATLKELIDFLENGTAKLQHDLTRYANWLKIQFTQIEKQGEQKFAWSEEDEEYLRRAINAVKNTYPMTANWLKSLKERYTWKPSDAQMGALHDLNLTGNISYAGQGQVLIELYNDLYTIWKEKDVFK